MEKTYNILEVFKTDSKHSCDYKLTEWRESMKDRLNRIGKVILSTPKGKAMHWGKAILFYDVKEEDASSELINSEYKREVISQL